MNVYHIIQYKALTAPVGVEADWTEPLDPSAIVGSFQSSALRVPVIDLRYLMQSWFGDLEPVVTDESTDYAWFLPTSQPIFILHHAHDDESFFFGGSPDDFVEPTDNRTSPNPRPRPIVSPKLGPVGPRLRPVIRRFGP